MSTKALFASMASCSVFATGAVASVVNFRLNGRPNDDITLGDRFNSLQVGELIEGPDATTLRWSSSAPNLSGPAAGLVTNPLYQQGSEGTNPLHGASDLRITFVGLAALYTWTDFSPLLLDFTVRFVVSDAADPAATPLAVINARGSGTATPPPSRPIGGGIPDGAIANTCAIRIAFTPGQAFTLPDGSPLDSNAFLFLGEGAEWSGFIIPTPGAAAVMGLGALAAARRRRS